MKLSVDRIDLKRTRSNWPDGEPFLPARVLPVEKLGGADWHVLDAPYLPGESPTWAHSAHDEYLRIPIFSYDLSPKADLALAFMLQMGLSCASYLPGAVSHFYVVTGDPVELLYDTDTDINTGLRYWFGFAVKLL
jgi:hypothetical protein